MIHRKVLIALLVGVVATLIVTYAAGQSDQPMRPGPRRSDAGGNGREAMRRKIIKEARRRFGEERIKLMGNYLGLIGKMQRVSFNPKVAGIVAVGGLKDDVKRKAQDIIKDLESQLEKTRSLGLRNSIRMALKDLYKAEGQTDKILANYRVMLAENDVAIGAAPSPEPPK